MTKNKKQHNSKNNQPPLPAGNFSAWLQHARSALVTDCGTDVACGECNACCRSSYFIHIRPEDKQAIARIPRELLFPAPGLPKGNYVLGYDETGRCPMLIDGQCSIYEARPTTCRNYDCRIFPAAGIGPGDDKKERIAQQIKRWQFSYSTTLDRDEHLAVQAAAKFLQEKAKLFPTGFIPANNTQLAILAIKVYEVFIGEDWRGRVDEKIVKSVIEANRRF